MSPCIVARLDDCIVGPYSSQILFCTVVTCDMIDQNGKWALLNYGPSTVPNCYQSDKLWYTDWQTDERPSTDWHVQTTL